MKINVQSKHKYYAQQVDSPLPQGNGPLLLCVDIQALNKHSTLKNLSFALFLKNYCDFMLIRTRRNNCAIFPQAWNPITGLDKDSQHKLMAIYKESLESIK